MSPNDLKTCPPRLGAAEAPWAPCSYGSGRGDGSPGADRSARRGDAPSTETDRLLLPWFSLLYYSNLCFQNPQHFFFKWALLSPYESALKKTSARKVLRCFQLLFPEVVFVSHIESVNRTTQ